MKGDLGLQGWVKKKSWVTGMGERGILGNRDGWKREDSREVRRKKGEKESRKNGWKKGSNFYLPFSLCSILPALLMFYDAGSG